MDIQALIQKLDKKQTTLLSTAILTVATTWLIRRAIKKSKEFKTLGAKEIPTPKGEYFYLGKSEHISVVNLLIHFVKGICHCLESILVLK